MIKFQHDFYIWTKFVNFEKLGTKFNDRKVMGPKCKTDKCQRIIGVVQRPIYTANVVQLQRHETIYMLFQYTTKTKLFINVIPQETPLSP